MDISTNMRRTYRDCSLCSTLVLVKSCVVSQSYNLSQVAEEATTTTVTEKKNKKTPQQCLSCLKRKKEKKKWKTLAVSRYLAASSKTPARVSESDLLIRWFASAAD